MDQAYLLQTGEWIMMSALPLLVETLFWTLELVTFFAIVITYCRKEHLKMHRNGRLNVAPGLAVICLIFLLGTTNWVLDIFDFFYQTRQDFLRGEYETADRTRTIVSKTNSAWYIIWATQLALGDTVIIWRAWCLSAGYRKVMIVPLTLLLGCCINIAILVSCSVARDGTGANDTPKCHASFIATWALSISANLSSTFIIAMAAWQYHRSQSSFALKSPVGTILRLLVESGLVYFVVMLCSSLLQTLTLPHYGASLVVSLIFTSAADQLVALTPMVTILLVGIYGSMFGSSTMSISAPLDFATKTRESSHHVESIV
ncbi:hypothetical protein C8J56DRAFT_1031212 [Mycena floridula]|nr:hypothetical protein C8J56DRAFT_1031212 [Mycena floridula]